MTDVFQYRAHARTRRNHRADSISRGDERACFYLENHLNELEQQQRHEITYRSYYTSTQVNTESDWTLNFRIKRTKEALKTIQERLETQSLDGDDSGGTVPASPAPVATDSEDDN